MLTESFHRVEKSLKDKKSEMSAEMLCVHALAPELPNAPSRCKWAKSTSTADPHFHETYPRDIPKIFPDISYHIGRTPLVRINKVSQSEGVECEMLVKCEFFNATGSVKDRIALRMIEDAEREGKLKPGTTIIEPTSGNTGIGLALVSALKGYKCIIVMPDRMSGEKVDILRALGAEIVRTPSAAVYNSPESNHSVAGRLNREIPNSIMLNQYRNEGNSLAHYDMTAEEILDQCDGQIDMFVAGGGTGGTLSGVGRKLKEKCPNCQIVGVDPVGSIIGGPDEGLATPMELEGIGHYYFPTVLDRKIADKWVKIRDRDSFLMCRRLIREEGLLVGGTSGSYMWAANQAAKNLKKGQKCVVILPDGVRNYMSTFVNDSWMSERDFVNEDQNNSTEHWWWDLPVSCLKMCAPVTIQPNVTCEDAIDIMDRETMDQLPVIDETGKVTGVVTLGHLLTELRSSRIARNSLIAKAMYKQFKQIFLDTNLGKVSRILDNDHFVMVVQKEKQYSGKKDFQQRKGIIGIISRMDLLKFITKSERKGDNLSGFCLSPSSGFSDSEQTTTSTENDGTGSC